MYQKMIVVGSVGTLPVLRTTASGTKVASFRIADNHRYTRDGKQVTETTWFSVNVWGRSAEVACERLQLGSVVLVEGRMIAGDDGNPRQYVTSAGKHASQYEISASNMRFLPHSKRIYSDDVVEDEEYSLPENN